MSFDVKVIKDSFSALAPSADEFADHFYSNLFESHPEGKALFDKVDLEKQKKALISALVFCVENLEEEEKIVSYLKSMGARHLSYDAKPLHYDWVGASIIKTLRQMFGDNWTAQAEESWTALYQTMAGLMIAGAEESQKSSKNGSASQVNRQPTLTRKSLDEHARKLAQNLFKKVLMEEIEGELMDYAREKARDVLRKALEEETDMVVKDLSRPAA